MRALFLLAMKRSGIAELLVRHICACISITKLNHPIARLVNGEDRIGIFASQIISYRLED